MHTPIPSPGSVLYRVSGSQFLAKLLYSSGRARAVARSGMQVAAGGAPAPASWHPAMPPPPGRLGASLHRAAPIDSQRVRERTAPERALSDEARVLLG
eukprot:gene12995-biopygen18530